MAGVPPTIEIGSIGIPDTMLLMLLALVVFGPRRLPEIGRQIGKLMYEFRKVSNDFKFQMEEELRASEEADRQKKLAAERAQAEAAAAALPATTEPAAPLTALEVGAEPVSAYGSTPEAAANPEVASAEAAPAVAGEVRGEPRSFPAGYVEGQIRVEPPSIGETVAAQKPFRGRAAEVTTESGDVADKELDAPVVVVDEGRIGTEVQPGVASDANTRTVPESGSETDSHASSEDGREVHHA